MSALAATPAPRLRAVPAASRPGRAGSPRRPRLRLVTPGFVPEPRRNAAVELPVELTRRPALPVAARPADGSLPRSQRRPRRALRAVSVPSQDAAVEARAHQTTARTETVPSAPARSAQRVAAVSPASPASPATGLAALPAAVRRAIVAGAVVLAAVALAAVGIIASGAVQSDAATPARTAVATVQSGESLWDVAEATGTSDVRETMAQIAELNSLDGSTVEAGQTLVVPAR
ncbi:hypothetical protein AXF14_12575 [Actinomyces radicidentis]|uniref:LysM domain-containing protein n=1 Tax=Actinomyces radicidentis TaxID=111015 RepID=A0A0X8JG89_ACTRD|nr:LysM peptidoglycan-binding domain-containing protein [Actinomyces radicidentis]AMD88260.1 hypothetical protein AXF14_12575 [Actinomyces radicidentis]